MIDYGHFVEDSLPFHHPFWPIPTTWRFDFVRESCYQTNLPFPMVMNPILPGKRSHSWLEYPPFLIGNTSTQSGATIFQQPLC